MDRIDKNGIICMITNNSFINSRTFDGFRKSIQSEFDSAYIIDLGGNIRENYGKKGQSIGNVFDIQVGVAIMFLIKSDNIKKKCQIHYIALENSFSKMEKLDWLKNSHIESISFEILHPDINEYWINIADNDWESLMQLYSKDEKGNSLFKLASNGISTNRDEWVYDFNKKNLVEKSIYFIDEYNHELNRWDEFKRNHNYTDIKAEANPVLDKFLSERNMIKWSKMIKRDKLRKGKKGDFDINDIRVTNYRPFTQQNLYYGYTSIDLRGAFDSIFPNGKVNNLVIAVNHTSSKDFNVLGSDKIIDLHFNGDSICISLNSYDKSSKPIDNITDWGLEQFVTHYKNNQIKKEDIFHYTYAVLHDPIYRKKYELNLKREFPRLPFYQNFQKWVDWGTYLMDLHIGYENISPFPLQEHTYLVKAEAKRQKELFANVAEPQSMYARQPKVKVKLIANKETGIIEIDELTFLTGVPKEAWGYKLGNRSALEWVLDQYKEKKPKDPTIAEKFNTYRFVDYKDKVIDLLKRVCTVSVETVRIIKEMEQSEDSN
jgi:predicted helicase